MENLKKFLKQNWLLLIAIVYLFWPLDLIADVIPFAGQTDDSVLLVIELVRRWYVGRKETSL